MQYQPSRVLADGLTAKHYSDQVASLHRLVAFLGGVRRIDAISTMDLQTYKRRLRRAYGSAHRLNLHIGVMKAMLHWARKNDVVENTPNIDAVSKSKIIHQERLIFDAEQIARILAAANAKMQAMIWLGLNCGFGCTDCAKLEWKNLDLDQSRVVLPRHKTGVPRNLPLWPETVQALRLLPRSGPLVFYTREGHPWIRTYLRTGSNGTNKHTTVNAISSMFARLLNKIEMHTPPGTGFYTLRRTAATLAARSGDPFAVQRLLGHANLQMATQYVQDVSEQTDRVIENSRKYLMPSKDIA